MESIWQKGPRFNPVNRHSEAGPSGPKPRVTSRPFVPPASIHRPKTSRQLDLEQKGCKNTVRTPLRPSPPPQQRSASVVSLSDTGAFLPLLTPQSSQSALYSSQDPRNGSPGFQRMNEETVRKESETIVRISTRSENVPADDTSLSHTMRSPRHLCKDTKAMYPVPLQWRYPL